MQMCPVRSGTFVLRVLKQVLKSVSTRNLLRVQVRRKNNNKGYSVKYFMKLFCKVIKIEDNLQGA